VRMDALAQLTGDLWQLSPSVFIRSRATGESQPVDQAGPFLCPACRQPLPDTPPELVCTGCGRTWPVEDGIYDFRLPSGLQPDGYQ
jgi:predicted amidophosphoribosyltransferase